MGATCGLYSMVAQWLGLSPHSTKVAALSPSSGISYLCEDFACSPHVWINYRLHFNYKFKKFHN